MVYNIDRTAVEWLIFVPQKHDETSKLLDRAITDNRQRVAEALLTLFLMLGDFRNNVRGLIATCDCFACIFKREDKNERGGPHQKYLSDFSPCNTGNPNQNYQVRTLRTNYRHEIPMTLQLVAGVIFAPPHPVLF